MIAGRDVTKPQPGFFTLRLVSRGVLVPARIYRPCPIDPFFGYPMDRYPALCADIDGEDCPVSRVWEYGRPITWAEWRFLTADGEHARAYRPAEPRANPKAAIDLNAIPTLF